MSNFNIDELPWEPPKLVETKVGPRLVRNCTPPADRNHPFWIAWATGDLKAQGYSLRRWKDDWQLSEWLRPDGTGVEVNGATAEDARDSAAPEAVDVELPATLQARYEEVERVYDSIEAETGLDYRYQLPSIRILALAIYEWRGGLDASDTGVGKTPVSCGVAKVLGRKIFVVCPKSVIHPWYRIAKLFGVEAIVINYEALRTGNTEFAYAFNERVVDRFGNEKRRKRFVWDETRLDPEEWLIVFDDCHKMKDFKTWNCLMGINAIKQGYHVLAGSATAADNPMQMKFVALLTGLISKAEHFFGWMQDHGVKQGKWGYVFVGGRKVLADIHRAIFPHRGNRIRIADLGNRFPATQVQPEPYDMGEKETREIQAVYAEMRREIAELEATEARDVGANVLTQILRARQRAELLKVPMMVDMAIDAVDEGMSVALFLNFDASIQAVSKRLIKRSRERLAHNTITGADRLEDRQRLIDMFNDDEIMFIVCNIKAGGTGVSLQGKASGRPRMAIISPTYSAIDLKQALGRVHRAGGAPSVQKIVFAADTVEERACAQVRRKLRNIATLNDGDLAV